MKFAIGNVTIFTLTHRTNRCTRHILPPLRHAKDLIIMMFLIIPVIIFVDLVKSAEGLPGYGKSL